VLRNGRRARPQAQGGGCACGRAWRALDELVVTVERTRTIVAQTPDRETKGDCRGRRGPWCQRDAQPADPM